MDSRVTERIEQWLVTVRERLGELSPEEAAHARASARAILVRWACEDWTRISKESDAVGAVIAMVELGRAIAKGDSWHAGGVVA